MMLYFPPPPTTTITNIKHHLDKNILNTATISFMDDEFDFILNFRWIVFVSIVLLDDLTAVVDTGACCCCCSLVKRFDVT